MRGALAVCLLVFAAAAPAAAARPVVIAGADPEAYRLDLRYLERGSGVLEGSERVDFVNRGPGPLARVWLRLWANGPDRCRPRRMTIRVDAPATAGRERVDCSALEVRLGEPVAPGGAGSIALRFRVRARAAADRFGRVGAVVLLGNVIPVLAVEDGRGLHLEPYTTLGESFYSVSARWDAVLRLPARLRAATTGTVTSEPVAGGERRLSVHSDQARDFGLAVGRLSRRETSVAGVRLRVHFGPRVRRARHSLLVARRAVRALTERLGPLPAPELDVVLLRASLTGELLAGMEYPELVFALPIGEVVTHEIAHQWWYGLVGNDQFNEPWLDESFASYSHERLHPSANLCTPGRPYRLVAPRRRAIPLDSSMDVFDRRSPNAIAEIVYGAGSCALQTLERGIGRPRMTAFLRLLQTRHRHGVLTRADVLEAIRAVAPRFRLRRWLRTSHLSP
jgi:hypothetical protein